MEQISHSIDKYIRRIDSGTVSRGRRVFLYGKIKPVSVELQKDSATFKVGSETGVGTYTVSLLSLSRSDALKTICTCPVGLACKHSVAALLYLKKNVVTQIGTTEPQSLFHSEEAEIKVPVEWQTSQLTNLASETLMRVAGRIEWTGGYSLFSRNFVFIQKAENRQVTAQILDGMKTFTTEIKKPDLGTISTWCNCKKRTFEWCEHKIALALYLNVNYGADFLDTLVDKTEQKRILLAEYGFSLNDKWVDKFEFSEKNGRISIKPLDPTIQKLLEFQSLTSLYQKFGISNKSLQDELSSMDLPERETNAELGLVVKGSVNGFADFRVIPIFGVSKSTEKNFSGNIMEVNPHFPPLYENYTDQDSQLLDFSSKISRMSILSYLASISNQNYNFLNADELFEYNYENALGETELTEIKDYIHNVFSEYQDLLRSTNHIYFSDQKIGITAKNLQRISFSNEKVLFKINVSVSDFFVEASLKLETESGTELKDVQVFAEVLIRQHETFYFPKNSRSPALIKAFGSEKKIKLHKSAIHDLIDKVLLPLNKTAELNLPSELTAKSESSISFKPAVELAEINGSHLVLKPVFMYGNAKMEIGGGESITVKSGSKYQYVVRDQEEEKKFTAFVKELHPKFVVQQKHGYYYISFSDALQQAWFLTTFETIRKYPADILGHAQLQHFKYSVHRPTFKTAFKTGIDWFDVKIEVTFGDQTVSLKDLRKAILANQNHVALADGTFGLLPEEWLQRYKTMFKLARAEKDSLKLSKFHFSVIDELYDQIDNEAIKADLDAKRERLKNFDSIRSVTLPKTIKATLRPYQQAGINWLNFLHEFDFGGCLADDMGLGKTLQTLAYLEYYIQQNKSKGFSIKPILIVCPNTLIFNWENEIKKFCPTMHFYIHHGQGRTASKEIIENSNLIITTYGTIRSDISWLHLIEFSYIVLDESQAIKNPEAKITKAVNLLKARHRLVLSGTPVQNNTFDLYAQMNFLNPGILGNTDFFKTNFSSAIDRENSVEQAEVLRKLIFPFLLRRTKEQVATDLPAKTESILWCEMGERQRQVYEVFKNEYRDFLLGKIAETGLENNQMHVLQGLTRLRQICDSPLLLPDNRYHTNDSVKADELIREITENVGNHKSLVFSQFLGMLEIIGNRLKSLGIDYAYLDGSTTDRKRVVENFQTDENCRVFLISLTAGGTGLNLTSADYVYIVDPWWNPAVENQAIDRTHRIGQNKSIFAYKMICKNTVEEKIIELQQRKKRVAADIIGNENSFTKSLSATDIEYLFS